MPDPNDGQRIASSWELVVKTKPEDQIHEDYWLFNQLKAGNGFVGKSGGRTITGPIEYALNTTFQSYSDLDTFSTTRVDVFDRYEYDWAEYVDTVSISDLEKDMNAGEGKLFDLLPEKLENARSSMESGLNEDFFGDGTGNSSKDSDGLQNLVTTTPTTGTVGGINRANFSFWRNQQTSGAKTTSAFDNLRATMRSIYNLSSNGVNGKHPTFGVATRTVFEGYEGLLTANERFTSKEDGDAGFKNERLKFKGAKLAYDNDCLAGALYWLNPMFLKLIYKTGAWFKGRAPVNPANQTVDIFVIRTMCELIATNPRMLGVVSGIT